MNTIYYLITRKMIRPFFLGLKVIWDSLFYMSSVTVLSIILPIIFEKYIFTPNPTTIGVISIVWIVIIGTLLCIRVIKQMVGDYDMDDEPEFLRQFVKDCCRSDNNLEKKYKQAKETKKQQKKEKKEKKELEVERIKYRSEILDL